MAVKTINPGVSKTVIKTSKKPVEPATQALSVSPTPSKSGNSPAVKPVAAPIHSASPVRTRALQPPAPPIEVVRAVPTEAPTLAVPVIHAPPTGDLPVASKPAISPETPSVQTKLTNQGPAPKQKVDHMMKNAEQFVAFGQANIEAMMKSGQIWTAGLQGLSKQMAANAQLALDETVTTMKAMTSVKSVKEALELQTSLARTAVEKAVAGTSQITDASMKLAEETMAPLTERMQVAASTFSIAA